MHNAQNLTDCESSPDGHDYMTRILVAVVRIGRDGSWEELDGNLGRCLKRMTRATQERNHSIRQRTLLGTL